MSTELSNGVIIPEEYSDDWYDEMSINLRKLNDVITAASDNATDIQRLDTDKANQSDLTALSGRVSQNETDITALQTAVSGALKREIVQTLPTEDISTTTIYMIRNSQSSGTNIYDEYMYINSQWELIGTSATDFSNYYTKTESDNLLSAKANQTDLTSLSGRVTQNETNITALQTAVSGALKREIVQSLPTQDISTTTIYMIRNTTTSGDNIYDEYMYINNLWELIGTSATDFSNYYTKTEIDTLLSGKADDNSVVHLSGNETVGGQKTFANNLIIVGRNTDSSSVIQLVNSDVVGGSANGTSGFEVYGTSVSDANKIGGVTVGEYSNNGGAYATIEVNRTVSGVKTTTAIRSLIRSDGSKEFLPSTDNDIKLGHPYFRWSEVYATNYYYGSNNVEFSTKFVTSDTAQTITERKTFTNTIKSQKEIEFTGNRLAYILPEFSAGYSGLSLCTYGSNGAVKIGTWKVDNNDNTKHVLDTSLGYLNVTTGSVNSVNSVYLNPKNATDSKLGDSTNKWKEINGLTPSSLSLPSTTGVVDISSYITDLTGTANTYTVLANGYIQFDVTGSSVEIDVTNGLSQKWIMTDPKGFIPVVSGASVSIKVVGTAINNFKFIPCQANI